MFQKVIYIVVAIVLATHLSKASVVKIKPKAAYITPYTLYEDALVKLGELKQIVQSAILTAHTDIEAARKDSADYSDQEGNKAEVEIRDETSRINGYIQDMVNLVESDGKDPNICLPLYRPSLDHLLTVAIDSLKSCITEVNKQIIVVISDGLSDIDSTNDKVSDVENQLLACTTGSILCVSPVVRLIDAYKIELPETIESLAHKTIGNIEIVRNEVDGCRSSSTTSFVTDAERILTLLENCFNAL